MAQQRNRTRYDDSKTLLGKLSSFLVPSEILKSFDLIDLKETEDQWLVTLHEKRNMIPKEMVAISTDIESIVLDGFRPAIHILGSCFNLNPVRLKIVRRRWRFSGSSKHYSNQYDFNIEGIKITHKMGAFLKRGG